MQGSGVTLCAKGPCRCQPMAARQASQPLYRLKMLSVSKCYIHDLALVFALRWGGLGGRVREERRAIQEGASRRRARGPRERRGGRGVSGFENCDVFYIL